MFGSFQNQTLDWVAYLFPCKLSRRSLNPFYGVASTAVEIARGAAHKSQIAFSFAPLWLLGRHVSPFSCAWDERGQGLSGAPVPSGLPPGG